MNFFLVESPLQYINAVEAKESLCNEEMNVLIVLNGVSEKNLIQIKNIIDEKYWFNIYFINGSNNRLKLYLCNKKLENIIYYYCKSNKVQQVFIGEYRSLLMRNIANKVHCNKIYLLDDGNASLSVHKDILNKNGHRDKLNIIRKGLNYLCGLNDRE